MFVCIRGRARFSIPHILVSEGDQILDQSRAPATVVGTHQIMHKYYLAYIDHEYGALKIAGILGIRLLTIIDFRGSQQPR